MEHQNWKISYIIAKGKPEGEHKDRKMAGVMKTNKKLPGKAPYLVDDDIMKGSLA